MGAVPKFMLFENKMLFECDIRTESWSGSNNASYRGEKVKGGVRILFWKEDRRERKEETVWTDHEGSWLGTDGCSLKDSDSASFSPLCDDATIRRL